MKSLIKFADYVYIALILSPLAHAFYNPTSLPYYLPFIITAILIGFLVKAHSPVFFYDDGVHKRDVKYEINSRGYAWKYELKWVRFNEDSKLLRVFSWAVKVLEYVPVHSYKLSREELDDLVKECISLAELWEKRDEAYVGQSIKEAISLYKYNRIIKEINDKNGGK